MIYRLNISFTDNKKIYSQNGEDGIIDFVFKEIGLTNKFCVEFGVGNGFESNTAYLRENGWNGLWMDYGSEKPKTVNLIRKLLSYKFHMMKKYMQYRKKQKSIKIRRHKFSFYSEIKKENVTAENIEYLFEKYGVPKEFDLLSIDIDYNDYWVWKAIINYNPRVVIIEYNASVPYTESRVVPYDPSHVWDGTDYFGASLLALKKLGESKGYTLIGTDNSGVNAFFVKSDIIKDIIIPIEDMRWLYHIPLYGENINGHYLGHPKSDKIMNLI